jgi:hypothetical protein
MNSKEALWTKNSISGLLPFKKAFVLSCILVFDLLPAFKQICHAKMQVFVTFKFDQDLDPRGFALVLLPAPGSGFALR